MIISDTYKLVNGLYKIEIEKTSNTIKCFFCDNFAAKISLTEIKVKTIFQKVSSAKKVYAYALGSSESESIYGVKFKVDFLVEQLANFSGYYVFECEFIENEMWKYIEIFNTSVTNTPPFEHIYELKYNEDGYNKNETVDMWRNSIQGAHEIIYKGKAKESYLDTYIFTGKIISDKENFSCIENDQYFSAIMNNQEQITKILNKNNVKKFCFYLSANILTLLIGIIINTFNKMNDSKILLTISIVVTQTILFQAFSEFLNDYYKYFMERKKLLKYIWICLFINFITQYIASYIFIGYFKNSQCIIVLIMLILNLSFITLALRYERFVNIGNKTMALEMLKRKIAVHTLFRPIVFIIGPIIAYFIL